MLRRFEGVRLIPLNSGIFLMGAAVALPGIGIVAAEKGLQATGLLRHEFGHILQFRKWGFFFFWIRIAPASLRSARKANRENSYNHMHCWTEWSANQLSYTYFGNPADWDFERYPVSPPLGTANNFPRKLKGINNK